MSDNGQLCSRVPAGWPTQVISATMAADVKEIPPMTCRYLPIAIFAAGLLGACAAASSPGEMPAVAAAAEPDAPPLEMHEASAQCWMKYDKSGGGLDAKAKLVDKCIDEKMKTQKPRPAPLAR